MSYRGLQALNCRTARPVVDSIGQLLVEKVGTGAFGTPRVISWGGDEQISRRIKPYDGKKVHLTEIPEWANCKEELPEL